MGVGGKDEKRVSIFVFLDLFRVGGVIPRFCLVIFLVISVICLDAKTLF